MSSEMKWFGGYRLNVVGIKGPQESFVDVYLVGYKTSKTGYKAIPITPGVKMTEGRPYSSGANWSVVRYTDSAGHKKSYSATSATGELYNNIRAVVTSHEEKDDIKFNFPKGVVKARTIGRYMYSLIGIGKQQVAILFLGRTDHHLSAPKTLTFQAPYFANLGQTVLFVTDPQAGVRTISVDTVAGKFINHLEVFIANEPKQHDDPKDPDPQNPDPPKKPTPDEPLKPDPIPSDPSIPEPIPPDPGVPIIPDIPDIPFIPKPLPVDPKTFPTMKKKHEEQEIAKEKTKQLEKARHGPIAPFPAFKPLDLTGLFKGITNGGKSGSLPLLLFGGLLVFSIFALTGSSKENKKESK